MPARLYRGCLQLPTRGKDNRGVHGNADIRRRRPGRNSSGQGTYNKNEPKPINTTMCRT